jgi:site-specific recombinase XerD
MTKQELEEQIGICMARLVKDGHSEEVIETNRWITRHFAQYCDENQYDNITFDTIVEFLIQKYAIDPYSKLCGSQVAIRRPLLILWEHSQTGTYMKSHLPEKTAVPLPYQDLYLSYCDHLNELALNVKTKAGKARYAKKFFSYLDSIGLVKLSMLTNVHAAQYMDQQKTFSYTTRQTMAYRLRELLCWLYDIGKISFNGFEAFPKIRYPGRKFISSCYSDDEVRSLMNTVDTNTIAGKHDYVILSLLVYYGMRISDILALKLENIDWSLDEIRLVQQKTKKPLILPLINEVKYPLLDYLKNARPNVENESHILITLCAPHTAYAQGQSLQRVIVKYMKKACIDFTDRHHGTHALRFSLAGNLLNESVPISAISGVLGHGSISTTNQYLELDGKDLKKLSLEVPNVSDT